MKFPLQIKSLKNEPWKIALNRVTVAYTMQATTIKKNLKFYCPQTEQGNK